MLNEKQSINCLACGIEFSYIRTGSRPKRFCSIKCGNNRFEHKCKDCKTAFKGTATARTCPACRINILALKRNRIAWNAQNIKRSCAFCEKEIITSVSVNKKYCNKACHYAHRRLVGYIKNCLECKTTFKSTAPCAKWCTVCEGNYKRDAVLRKSRAHMAAIDYSIRNEYIAIISKDPCSFCQSPGITKDHIKAVSKGGKDTWDNLTAACNRCNSSKHDKDLLMFLLQNPIGSR